MHDDMDCDINDGPKLHPKQDDDFWNQILIAAFTTAVIVCALTDPVEMDEDVKPADDEFEPVTVLDKEPILRM